MDKKMIQTLTKNTEVKKAFNDLMTSTDKAHVTHHVGKFVIVNEDNLMAVTTAVAASGVGVGVGIGVAGTLAIGATGFIIVKGTKAVVKGIKKASAEKKTKKAQADAMATLMATVQEAKEKMQEEVNSI